MSCVANTTGVSLLGSPEAAIVQVRFLAVARLAILPQVADRIVARIAVDVVNLRCRLIAPFTGANRVRSDESSPQTLPAAATVKRFALASRLWDAVLVRLRFVRHMQSPCQRGLIHWRARGCR